MELQALQEKAKTSNYILHSKEDLFAMSSEEVKYALRWNIPFFERVVALLPDIVEQILISAREESEDERILSLEETLRDTDSFGYEYESSRRCFADILLGCIEDCFAE